MSSHELQRHALWLLLPTLETEDPNLQYYYDFEPALAEYKRVFAELGCDWQWRRVRLDSIAAVSIGGANLSGGVGTVVGTLFGVLILSVLNNIMNLIGVPPTMQPAIKGLVILIAVYLNSARKQ